MALVAMWKVVGCLGFKDGARKTLYSGGSLHMLP